jgi:hypothetical protein
MCGEDLCSFRASPTEALKFGAVKVICTALEPDIARDADASFARGSILQRNHKTKKQPFTRGCKIELHKQVSSTFLQQTRSNRLQINLKNSTKFQYT